MGVLTVQNELTSRYIWVGTNNSIKNKQPHSRF